MNRSHIAGMLATILVALAVRVAAVPRLPSPFYGTVTITGRNF